MTVRTTTDPQPRPVVRRLCVRCAVRWKDVDEQAVIVSPSGMAHFPRPWGDTQCGRHATGARWWWPE